MKKNPPVVLTIAGSDNSCGAGAQADLKTITALGGYAQTAITCVVAEVPGKVEAIRVMLPDFVAAQMRLSFEAFPVAAVKTGMLFSAPIIRAVASSLKSLPKMPLLVVDPVMVASSGDSLLKASAVKAYRDLLFPLAALVTPNLDELRILSEMPCRNLDEIRDAGQRLVEMHGCAFLLKGGHLRAKTATDLLVTRHGVEVYEAPYLRSVDAHGTGCTFSAAIATFLAAGLPLPEAVRHAKDYITEAISRHLRWKKMIALEHRTQRCYLPGMD